MPFRTAGCQPFGSRFALLGGRGLALHHRRESLLDAAGFLMVKTPLLNALAKLAAHVLRASKCQIEIFCGFIYCLRQFLTKLFFKEWEH